MSEFEAPRNCRDVDSLLSLECDHELNLQQRQWLDQHLQECPTCHHRRQRFAQIDGLIGSLGDLSELGSGREYVVPVARSAKPVLGGTAIRERRWTQGVAAVVAVAVVFVLAAVAVTISLESETRADDVLAPMVSLAEINHQRIRDQEMMKESLNLELRTLKLQFASLLAEESASGVRQKIDRLSSAIDRFEVASSESK